MSKIVYWSNVFAFIKIHKREYMQNLEITALTLKAQSLPTKEYLSPPLRLVN